ncbi:MAG: SOS response-associated peptidase [Sandaracinaceae bacterium]|nr:SOS response-associated peptidase [Sandaracinaceae bacterium]
MCARYTMITPTEVLVEELEATLTVAALPPRYNIAPTDDAPIVVLSREGERRLGLARFGLIPHWAKSAREGVRMLNARVETVAEKPAFRDAFARRRCLVAADGFYEWETRGKEKLPHRFHLAGRPFAFAGLWATWRDPDGVRVVSFAILTCPAVGAVAPIHDRMPIVLPHEAYAPWLATEGGLDADGLRALLAAHLGDYLEDTRVSTRVNQVKNDDPSLVVPLPPEAC